MSAQFATVVPPLNDAPRGTFNLFTDSDGRTRIDACLPFALGAQIASEVQDGGRVNTLYSDGEMMLIDAHVSADGATRVLRDMIAAKLI